MSFHTQKPFVRRRVTSATLFAGLFSLSSLSAVAVSESGPEYVLHVNSIQTQGYVVGLALAPSGIHRLTPHGEWVHLGWNTPRALGLAYDPSNPSHLYLAAGASGLLHSSDDGANWRVMTPWRITETTSVAVDYFDAKVIYLATSYGVYRSLDGGETWLDAKDGLTRRFSMVVQADFTQPGRALLANELGVYESIDHGSNWRRISPSAEVLDIRQSRQEPLWWVAGADGAGVLISEDGGANWRVAELPTPEASVYSVSINPFAHKEIVAAGWDTGVLLSRDGGHSWHQIGGNLPTPHFYRISFDYNTAGSIWAGTVEAGLFYSPDFGQTWQKMGKHGTLIFDLTFIPASSGQ